VRQCQCKTGSESERGEGVLEEGRRENILGEGQPKDVLSNVLKRFEIRERVSKQRCARGENRDETQGAKSHLAHFMVLEHGSLNVISCFPFHTLAAWAFISSVNSSSILLCRVTRHEILVHSRLPSRPLLMLLKDA
jgi:hypothetical protein